ncbi:hypothetical protein [Niallia taxi]
MSNKKNWSTDEVKLLQSFAGFKPNSVCSTDWTLLQKSCQV